MCQYKMIVDKEAQIKIIIKNKNMIIKLIMILQILAGNDLESHLKKSEFFFFADVNLIFCFFILPKSG
jgi:hypothetical protein